VNTIKKVLKEPNYLGFCGHEPWQNHVVVVVFYREHTIIFDNTKIKL